MTIPSGKQIPIEERSSNEVRGFRDYHWAAEGVSIKNPAFDVTPAELVTAIITEQGVVFRPNAQKLQKLFT
jgi:methylthioribose-1-phosphate isomerase